VKSAPSSTQAKGAARTLRGWRATRLTDY
jgi:hypothetical protein